MTLIFKNYLYRRKEKFIVGFIGICLIANVITSTTAEQNPWKWLCKNEKCVKTRNSPMRKGPVMGLDACRISCGYYGVLWPRPTGHVIIGDFLSNINMYEIYVKSLNSGAADDLLVAAGNILREKVAKVLPEGVTPKRSGKSLSIYVILQYPNINSFTLDLDESYVLRVSGSAESNNVSATISANSFFGARHALETLSQLVIYDEISDHLLIVRDADILDAPVYSYRGLLLDTARNYFDLESIKRTIDGMSSVKLNTFHWHITDSQSFPFVSLRRPNLSKFGAYSPKKVYTAQAVKEIVKYGLERGVRVLPEFAAPSHVGEGWQNTGLTVCFNEQPFAEYCLKPPCGSLNPTLDEVYNYLEDIYTDMAEAFNPDMFHMGGDQVKFSCWQKSDIIMAFMESKMWNTENGFVLLWNYFQKKAQEKAYKAFGKRLPLIVRSSSMTDRKDVVKHLNKNDYIIQAWTNLMDQQVQDLLQKGYRIIISNYETLALDGGFGPWSESGINWNKPFIPWTKIYDNSPAALGIMYKNQILGAEAVLWSEQTDPLTLDNRLWPRLGALAERLWAEPKSSWIEAKHRMLYLRERLVRIGIRADTLLPEWCQQHEGHCANENFDIRRYGRADIDRDMCQVCRIACLNVYSTDSPWLDDGKGSPENKVYKSNESNLT